MEPPTTPTTNSAPSDADVAKLAFEKFKARGSATGHEKEDWAAAAADLASKPKPLHRGGKSLKVALIVAAVLVVGLAGALVARVVHLRAAAHGLAGGSGVIEGLDVNVTSRVATRVVAVTVHEGDVVKRGDVLVELDCVQLEADNARAQAQQRAAEGSVHAADSTNRSANRNVASARRNVDAAHSQLDALATQLRFAEDEFRRIEELLKSGATTVASLDEARSKRDQLAEQLTAQRATEGASREQVGALSDTGLATGAQATVAERNVDVARAEVASTRAALRECKLVAPRDGMVATRIIEPGEAVAPGTAILTITDVTEARTRFYLPNSELAAAAAGRPVHVVADAYPGQSFAGTIFYVSPRAEFTPRNVQTREDRERLVYSVEVRIPNPDLKLRSGMPVEVTIDGSHE